MDVAVPPDAADRTSQEIARLEARIEELLAQNTALSVNLGRMRRAFEARGRTPEDTTDSSAEIERLSRALDARAHEIAVLTRKLEDSGAVDPAELAAVKAERDEIRSYAAGLEYSHLHMLESSSWRMTRPFRGLLRLLRGQPRTEPFRARFLDYGS